MLDDRDLARLRQGFSQGAGPIQLQLHRPPAGDPGASQTATDSAGSDLARFVEQLLALGEDKFVRTADGVAWVPAKPALSFGVAGRWNFSYLGVPEGHQVEPLVELVLHLAKPSQPPTQRWQKTIGQLERAVRLMVFTGTTCPHCPLAVRAAHQLALTNAQVSVAVVDAQKYPELTERFVVKAVPLTVLDGGLSLVGVVSPEQLCEHILARGSEPYEQQVFESLVGAGRLNDVALQLQSEDGLARFGKAWRASTTASRMALLVVVEDLLEQDRSALDSAVVALLPALEADDAALQGDTADLLGRIGHEAASAAVSRLLGHGNPDVAEIAAEALEEIKRRNEP